MIKVFFCKNTHYLDNYGHYRSFYDLPWQAGSGSVPTEWLVFKVLYTTSINEYLKNKG